MPTEQNFGFFKQLVKMVKDFIRRDWIKDKLLEEPKKLKTLVVKSNVFDLIVRDIINNAFAYMMLLATHLIANGHNVLGISCYVLYLGKDIINDLYHKMTQNLDDEIKFLTRSQITVIASQILGSVRFKVYQTKHGVSQQVSNEQVTNCIQEYLSCCWDIQQNYIFKFAKLSIAIGMLIVSILANDRIPQKIFVPFLLVSCTISVLCSMYDRFHQKKYRSIYRELSDKERTLENDVSRVVPIIKEDQESRISRLERIFQQNYENEKDFHKKDFFSDIASSLWRFAATIGLVLIYSVPIINEVTVESITYLVAMLTIFNTALGNFDGILRIFDRNSWNWDKVDNERELLENILATMNESKKQTPVAIDVLAVPDFEIQYEEHSENDKSFTLILQKALQFEKGDIVELRGPSGGGKSTFLKLCTSRISFANQKGQKMDPVNYTFYDETISFGSFPIWDELFCLDGKNRIAPSASDLDKMQYILENLHLWKELKNNCNDVWTFAQEHLFSHLSNGQKQRLILAKILFWLNPDVDIVALDECTSGLDSQDNDEENADALTVLKFVINYCNRDKKRIIILSTHQPISSLCTRHLIFKKDGNGKTIICEQ